MPKFIQAILNWLWKQRGHDILTGSVILAVLLGAYWLDLCQILSYKFGMPLWVAGPGFIGVTIPVVIVGWLLSAFRPVPQQ
jgi:hypothetical protein